MSWSAARATALEYLSDGKAGEAFLTLTRTLRDPVAEELDFGAVCSLLASVASKIGAAALSERARSTVHNSSDPAALHAVGLELYRAGAFGAAATFFRQTVRGAPGQEGPLVDLASALEADLQNEAAVEVLRGAKGFMPQYLLAFNTLMTGDRAAAAERIRNLPDGRPDMVAALKGMLARAEVLSRVTPLDSADLRGWQAAIDGTILLHLSPAGGETMNGRYGFVQENYSLLAEGIARLHAVLEVLKLKPPRVLILPELGSQILGQALAEKLKIPASQWSGKDRAPGLIAAYDLDRLEPEVARALTQHYPGQILWSHAARWTEPFPVAPDIVTYLYEIQRAPWDPQIVEEDGEIYQEEADAAPLAQKAKIDAASRPELRDLPALLSMTLALRDVPPEHAAGLFRAQGPRLRQRAGSPVKSAILRNR